MSGRWGVAALGLLLGAWAGVACGPEAVEPQHLPPEDSCGRGGALGCVIDDTGSSPDAGTPAPDGGTPGVAHPPHGGPGLSY
ncbi:hypothetical protein P2318_21705 [Myxococcaceae bacterium GXIMD 01537]